MMLNDDGVVVEVVAVVDGSLRFLFTNSVII